MELSLKTPFLQKAHWYLRRGRKSEKPPHLDLSQKEKTKKEGGEAIFSSFSGYPTFWHHKKRTLHLCQCDSLMHLAPTLFPQGRGKLGMYWRQKRPEAHAFIGERKKKRHQVSNINQSHPGKVVIPPARARQSGSHCGLSIYKSQRELYRNNDW